MERPRTGGASSVAFSEVRSIASVASSSLDGSQLNALVARRSQLRAQLGVVETQLKQMPPSTAGGSSQYSGAPVFPRQMLASGPLPAPITRFQTPAREGAAGKAQQLLRAMEPARPQAVPAISASEDGLPGAMRPGNYAFWPKRLPGAAGASRRSRGAPAAAAAAGGGAGLGASIGRVPACATGGAAGAQPSLAPALRK